MGRKKKIKKQLVNESDEDDTYTLKKTKAPLNKKRKVEEVDDINEYDGITKDVPFKGERTCFQCGEQNEKGCSIIWQTSNHLFYDVWVCNRYSCRIDLLQGNGWYAHGNHTMALCSHCENIILPDEVDLNAPCLGCNFRPFSKYIHRKGRFWFTDERVSPEYKII